MTTSLSNITVKDGQNTLVVKANDITINGSSILTTNNFVTLDTDQSITGAKTFTSGLYLTKDTPQITLKSTSIDITQSGWAKGRNTIAWCQDKNGNESGGVFNAIETDSNKIFTDMYAMSRKTGSQVAAHLRIGIDENGNPYATAPTPAVSDNSNKLATTAWVNNQKYVTLNTNQTITGTKTFTNAVIKQLSTNNSSGQYQDTYKVVDTNLDTTTNPEYIKQYYHAVKDKNNNYLAFIASTYNTDGSSDISLNARTRNTDNSGNVQGMIKVSVKRDGTIIAEAPIPATSDNSNKIATTAYCNKKHQVVSALPASPDANVFYYIPA